MAGYFEHSKSNNALEAEAFGRYPASVLAKRLGVNPGAIRALLRPSEWHHTSKYFNCTDYYSEEDALERAEELRAWKPEKPETEVYQDCTGSYLVWGGTRNHPKATEVKFGPVRVTKKGKWFTLEIPGCPIRKNEATRGFEVRDKNGRRLN